MWFHAQLALKNPNMYLIYNGPEYVQNIFPRSLKKPVTGEN